MASCIAIRIGQRLSLPHDRQGLWTEGTCTSRLLLGIVYQWEGALQTVMDLLEYQAKELFQEVGIPVLPSQKIAQLTDLRDLRIPYPIVLKSQVYAGRRSKLGGIKFAENTIDAIAAAQSILNIPIQGQYPRVLLAESKYEPDQEVYLAVTLDSSARRPVILGSLQGGVAVEAHPELIHHVVVNQAFSPFYARQLAAKMGLQGKLLQSVSSIIEKMYSLFSTKDLDLVEINPLAISSSGDLMALDGKVIANESALARHADLVRMRREVPHRHGKPSDAQGSPGMNLAQLSGKIGVICNGAGLTMATLDLIAEAGEEPAIWLNLGSACQNNCSSMDWSDRIRQALAQVMMTPNVQAVLLNLIGLQLGGDALVEAITTTRPNGCSIPVVVRMVGAQSRPTVDPLPNTLIWVEGLDEAIAQVVTQVQPSRKGRPSSSNVSSSGQRQQRRTSS
jgi:succinyl-CoA synthetase beta subunit